MLVPIQRMTAAEALAGLDPYDDVNRNSTVYMFYDATDDNKLKGVFFDDTVVGDKVIRDFSAGNAGGLFSESITVTMNKAIVNALDVASFIVSRNDLGLAANEGAIFDITNFLWEINPDGLPFATAGGRIDVLDGLGDRISILPEATIEGAVLAKSNISSSGNQVVDTNVGNDGLEITATAAITDGGANSEMIGTFYYKKVIL